MHLNVLESSWKHRCLDLTHRISTLVGLKWDLKCAFLGPRMMFGLLAQGSQHESHWMLSLLVLLGNSSASIMSEMFTLSELNVEITKISYSIFYSNKILKLVSLGLICLFHLIVTSCKTVTHMHTHKHIHILPRIHVW